jgi:hypothetical protein
VVNDDPAQSPDPLVSDAVLIALIGAVGSIFTGVISVVVLIATRAILDRAHETRTAVDATHDLVNGKMTELTKALIGQSHAEGVTAGEQAQRDRTAEPQT